MGSVFQRILCCSDLSERSLAAYRAAARLAAQNQAELSLLHVVPPGELVPGLDPAQARELPDPARAKLWKEHLRATHLALAPGQPCAIYLRKGQPPVEILEHLKEHPADLVVLGSEGLSGVGLVLLGSVAERVTRQAPCSCLVVRQP